MRGVTRSASITRNSSSSAEHSAHPARCAVRSTFLRDGSIPSTYSSSSGLNDKQRMRNSGKTGMSGREGFGSASFALAHPLRERQFAAMDQRLDVTERKAHRLGDRLVFEV